MAAIAYPEAAVSSERPENEARPLAAVAVSTPLSPPPAGLFDRAIVTGPLYACRHVAIRILHRDREAERITRRDAGWRRSRDHELRGRGGRHV